MKGSSSAPSLRRPNSRATTPSRRDGGYPGSTDRERFRHTANPSMATEVYPFDLGVFYVLAEQYQDKPYAGLAMSLMDRAPPGSVLRNTAVSIQSKKTSKPARGFARAKGTADDQKKDPATSVVFHLPTVDEHGGLNWDLSTYALPTGRDKESREARVNLFKYLDASANGSVGLVELKAGFSGMVSVPGNMDAKTLLSHGLEKAFEAVQDLMLDGFNSEKSDEISGREFRVFLIFLQRYLELYEIFCSIDNSSDQMIAVEEFVKAIPKLEAWGMNDPLIIRNPEAAFRRMDKDGSGSVTFPEFAAFCVRQGLVEEVDREIRNKES